ncbi:hypothetical protein BH11PSE1_BH11PSE1_07410 [soil metagenome]
MRMPTEQSLVPNAHAPKVAHARLSDTRASFVRNA